MREGRRPPRPRSELPGAVSARLPPGDPPALLVVIDTEERFAWGKGFYREQTDVSAIRKLERVQRIFDEYGITPTYVLDYPVATQPEGAGPLREFHASGRAVLGAHLHPWVNPPHVEETTNRNSYPGNLERNLEAAKIRALTAVIGEAFGVRATIYKAGRYGFGPNTASILEEQGYEIDLSVDANADLRPQEGPDFLDLGPEPFWFGARRRLLEIPTTAGFVGALARHGTAIRRTLDRRGRGGGRIASALARLGALERLRLSPEGMTLAHLKRLTRALLRRGVRVLTFSFHSPTVEPGCTGYVRDETELAAFLDRCRAYFDFFLEETGGKPTTPDALLRRMRDGAA